MAVVAILVATAVILLISWLFSIEKKRKHFESLGGPKGIPILGNALQLKRHPGGEKFILVYLQIYRKE